MEGRLLLAILVDTLSDEVDANGVTSLREAIVEAASSPGDDVITFAPDLSGAIDLALGQLTLDDHSGAVTIEATPTVSTIDAGGNSGVFYVASSTTAVLNGLTITGGRTSYSGGGVVNLGTLTLTGSTVSGNSAARFGGGVFSRRGTLTVTDSTVSGNSAGYGGGGVYNFLGTLTVTDSTVSGNSAAASGGGVDNFYGTLTLTNSTISGNTAAYGGGVWSSGSATITHATITDNEAGDGGGLFQTGFASEALFNTIVSGNRLDDGAATPDDLSASSGNVHGVGNLVGTGGEALDPDSNLVGVLDPRLGPLADNGGPTRTHLLLSDSPAIDVGQFLPTPVTTDQRGFDRPRGSRPDAGSVELDTGAPPPFEPGSLVVTTLDDVINPFDQQTSLREAITLAKATPGDDTITFAAGLAGTIHLGGFGALVLDDRSGAFTINDVSRAITIDAGGGVARVFQVPSGATVNLLGLTITGGAAGGVFNNGTLTLTGATITGNSADTGGGVYNARYGTLTVTDSTISGNSTYHGGGGVYNRGTVTLTDSTVSGNSANSGGGIVNFGTATLNNSTVSGNTAGDSGSGVGGGISNNGTLTLAGSTVSGNTAGFGGGGIDNGGTLTLAASTISGNSAGISGGGIFNSGGGTVTLTNSTISGNTAARAGGGGVWSSGSATITHATITDNEAAYGGGLLFNGPTALFNTIVSGNRLDDGAATPDDLSNYLLSGTIRGVGNLVGTGGEALDPDSNLVGVLDPRLGPLADNGGPTRTHLPLSDSPAIDLGQFLPTPVTTDQRGFDRPRGPRPDAGSVELDTGPPSGVPEAGGTVVTTLRDVYDPYDGLTSIREALAFAASHPGDDAITFDPSLSGVVELKNFGELALDDATGTVTIEASAGVSTMDAGGLDRVLRVASGTTAVLDGWTLQGGAVAGDGSGVWNSGTLTLAGSSVSGNSAYHGGGVYNGGTLTLTGSTVSGNTARVGGGVYNRGTLKLTDSTISGNSAASYSYGGGIFNSGTATLTGSTVSGNTAGYSGGGIDNWGTLTLTGSTVSGNSAGLYGGGILNNFYGTLTLTDSTLSGNRSEGVVRYGIYGPYAFGGDGGGLFNSGTATLTNTTIAGNAAARYGGGVFNGGTLTLTSSTVSGNSAVGDGGGIANGFGQMTLTNSIVAGNTKADGTSNDIGGYSAAAVAGSCNLIGAGGSGGLQDGVDGNIVGVADPLLAPLGDYGGPTWTMPLLPGSRAIDAGGGDGLPSWDQRGLGRVGAPDIGAFESQGFTFVVLTGSTPQSAVVSNGFTNPLGVVVTAANPVEPVAGGVVNFVAIPSSGGASATFAAPATIGADGTALVVATANLTPGSYSVVASAAGVANSVAFALTNTPASVTAVSVAWGSAGSAALETAADGLRLLAEGRTTTLPWSGIRSISITFDGAPDLTPSDVKVRGEAVADYGPVTISRSGTSYTITFARPITSADRVTITIADPSMTTFIRRLDVLPGDVNDNGSVDAIDLMLIRRALTPYDPPETILPMFLDINGDGVANVDDYIIVRRNVGTRLKR